MAAPRSSVLVILLILALTHGLSCRAHAEVRVEGRTDSVSVEVREASLNETLGALSAAFGVVVSSSGSLDRQLNGSYQGNLRQVIAQLLAGRNYVMIHSGNKIEIKIFDLTNERNPQPIASPPVTRIVPTAAPRGRL
jgi:hypothetical protein